MISQDFIKEEVIQAFGTVGATAEFFGIRSQSVSLWPAGKSIPELRQLEIRHFRPDLVSRRKRKK